MRNVFQKDELYFVPLGGSEEFGCNLNLYVCNDEYLAIDCGIGFADERFPGIDLLLPDPVFLQEHKDKLVGLVITHAHEDHIGAVAYLWDRLQCPIYCTKFTAAVLRRKLSEHGVNDAQVNIIEPMKSFSVSSYMLEAIPVSHSVPDSISLKVKTEFGTILHSGDWNLDENPIIGEKTEEERFKAIGAEGVLAYVGDSTNAGVDGFAGSEKDVAEGMAAEFKKHNGKIAVTIFASNIGRIVSIVRAAQEVGRSVALIGRSLNRMIACAYDCGYLKDLPSFIDEDDIHKVPDENLVLIVTGSQGEHRAALARIARGDHRSASFSRGDTVIFSSRAIPGNERRINTVKNDLSAGGVNIVTPSNTDNIIHVSGHPCREEITQMIQWLRPECVVPVHGERVQIDAQAALAKSCQVKHICTPNNGSVIRLAPGEPCIVDHVETGNLAVDIKRIIPLTHQSISARRKLQYSGMVHASLVLDQDYNTIGKIKISTAGLSCNVEDDCMIDDLTEHLESELDRMDLDLVQGEDDVAEKLRISLRRYVSDVLGLRPKTTVHVAMVEL